jgi:hypothetical protein
MPNYLINEIPDIKNKSYLELGMFDGYHFTSIQAASKTSVDIAHPADFVMSTDEFFQQVSSDERWDIIYIDADHTWTSILKDFNNSVRHLNLGGSIFLHDLHPLKKELTQPQFCGDAFRFLYQLLLVDYPNTYTMDEDYGITFMFDPQSTLDLVKDIHVTYQGFVNLHTDRRQLYTKAEMISIIKECYNG